MRAISRSPVACFTLALFVAACGGGDGGTPTGPGNGGGGGGGGGGGSDRQIVANPSFSTHIQEIFGRRGCTDAGCHGDAPQAGLDLRSSVAWQELVNVTSTNEPSFLRVAPNDAQNSYLVIKIEGRQNVGTRMPQNGAALDNIDVTNIRNWIADGAPNN